MTIRQKLESRTSLPKKLVMRLSYSFSSEAKTGEWSLRLPCRTGRTCRPYGHPSLNSLWPTWGHSWDLFVQPIILIQYTSAICLDGRNRPEKIPHHFKVVVHLPLTPHDIAQARVFITVTRSTRYRILFKHMNAVTAHLAVPNQITCGCQCRQAGSNDIGRFGFNSFGLAGPGKSLIVTTCVIHI